MKFALIDAEKTGYPVEFMCEQLEVSRSGYYAWRDRGPSKHAQDDEELAAVIVGFHAASRQTYGSPRIHEQAGREADAGAGDRRASQEEV